MVFWRGSFHLNARGHAPSRLTASLGNAPPTGNRAGVKISPSVAYSLCDRAASRARRVAHPVASTMSKRFMRAQNPSTARPREMYSTASVASLSRDAAWDDGAMRGRSAMLRPPAKYASNTRNRFIGSPLASDVTSSPSNQDPSAAGATLSATRRTTAVESSVYAAPLCTTNWHRKPSALSVTV